MPTDAQEIADFAYSLVREDGRMAGARLGAAIKERFPQTELRKQFGGLRQFIQTQCGDRIEIVDKQGLDDVYAVNDAATALGLNPQAASTGETAWQAYSNPNATASLGVRLDTGAIAVAGTPEQLPPDFRVVPKLTLEDHRQIAERFLGLVETQPIKDELANAIKHDPFWPAWSRVVNRRGEDGLFEGWMAHRTRCIDEGFRSQLRELGAAEPAVAVAASRLLAAKRRRPVGRAIGDRVCGDLEIGWEDPRGLVRLIVDQLPLEDVRRIQVPLGAVLDALAKGHQTR